MQLPKFTALLAVAGLSAAAEVIGNRHPDERCLTKIFDPVYDGKCIETDKAGSIALHKKMKCTAFESRDCSGEGKLQSSTAGCHSMKSWGNPGSAICFSIHT